MVGNEETNAQKEVEQTIMDIFFKVEQKPKKHRHKCLDCGRVSVNVFCRECHRKRWDAKHKAETVS